MDSENFVGKTGNEFLNSIRDSIIILSVYFFRVSHQRSFHFQFHEKALKDNSIDTREKNAEICTYISGFKRANTGVFATFSDFDVESEIEKVYWTLNFSQKHVVWSYEVLIRLLLVC